jgi:hypothetical protein
MTTDDPDDASASFVLEADHLSGGSLFAIGFLFALPLLDLARQAWMMVFAVSVLEGIYLLAIACSSYRRMIFDSRGVEVQSVYRFASVQSKRFAWAEITEVVCVHRHKEESLIGTDIELRLTGGKPSETMRAVHSDRNVEALQRIRKGSPVPVTVR